MYKLRSTALAALILLCSSSLLAAWGNDPFHPASPDELAMKNTAIGAGTPAAILEWLQRKDDTTSVEEEYVRIKVFGPEGKKYGDIELPYMPGTTSIRGIVARTILPDGTIVPFKGEVFDKLLVKAGRERLMAKTFSLPNVQPGSILEYRYERRYPEHILYTSHWEVQRELPILKARLWFKPYEKEFSSYFTYTGLAAGKKPVRVGDHYELELDNVIAFEKEPHAPPEEHLKPRVDFFYQRGRVISGDLYWNTIAHEFAGAIEGFIGDRQYVRQSVEQFLVGAKTNDEKLHRIYERVQKIRNTTYDIEKTEQETKRENLSRNSNVEDVLRNGYGNRDQITRLFVAMTRAAGLDAWDVAVAPRDHLFFSKELPDSGQLSGEIAVVNSDGKSMYLDPGTPYAPYGTISWENTNVMGMRIAKKSDALWVEIPPGEPKDAVRQRTADLHLDGDVLKGTVHVTFSGEEALVHRLSLRGDDDAAAKKSMEEEVKGWFPEGATVKQTKMGGLRSWTDALVADYEVELPNITSFTGSRALVPMSVFSVARKNPFASERRKYPVYFEYPYQDLDEITLHLPDGYAVESLPRLRDVSGNAIGYVTKVAAHERDVTFTRKMYVATVMVDTQYYPTIRKFFSNVGVGDQESLVLKKVAP
jgi:hypothetical protein